MAFSSAAYTDYECMVTKNTWIQKEIKGASFDVCNFAVCVSFHNKILWCWINVDINILLKIENSAHSIISWKDSFCHLNCVLKSPKSLKICLRSSNFIFSNSNSEYFKLNKKKSIDQIHQLFIFSSIYYTRRDNRR